MNCNVNLRIFILFSSLIYQIWVILTIFFVGLNEYFNVPDFVKLYVKAISGFLHNPASTPSFVVILFVLGGICMGLTLGIDALKWCEKRKLL